jgi:hypothetical protein
MARNANSQLDNAAHINCGRFAAAQAGLYVEGNAGPRRQNIGRLANNVSAVAENVRQTILALVVVQFELMARRRL